MPEWPAKRELDTYVCKRPLRSVSVRRAAVADIAPLLKRARAEIADDLADIDDIARIIGHNGECIWVVDRAGVRNRRQKTTVGFHAFLPLLPGGAAALLEGRFAFLHPDIGHIATPGEQPIALYWWASMGTGTTATAISRIMEKLRTPRYRLLDIYSRPATSHGARALLNVGFRPLTHDTDPLGSIVVYRRLANRALAAHPQMI